MFDGDFASSGLRIRLYLTFWLVLVVGFVYSIQAQIGRLDELEAQEADLRRQIQAAHQVTRDLEYDLMFHYSDAFVERVARERLGFIRADETIFINDAR